MLLDIRHRRASLPIALAAAVLWCVCSPPAFAQVAGEVHDHSQMPGAGTGWRLVQDGVIHALFNHQGGPRGGDELVVPNWWMGMLSRDVGRHRIGMNLMLSLDRATIGGDGYRELFQAGETFNGQPLIDHQHPHDFFTQAALTWRVPIGTTAALTLAGGLAGEPTLGPVAFMHRASGAGLPFAPLGHHTFDSTHISFGVVAASFTSGRWTLEASAFNGREPDEQRWDFDFGALDSYAGRVWFRPAPAWEAQVSTGLLRDPEALEPGDVRRTTVSASWYPRAREPARASHITAVTAGYGVNLAHDTRRQAGFGEFTVERATNGAFGRLEVQQVEAHLLLGPDADHTGDESAVVIAATLGATRRVASWRRFEGALGAQFTVYRVPDQLKPEYGERPVSFQLFFRVRLPSAARMWEMRMTTDHAMGMDH